MPSTQSLFGSSIKRREDPRLITGKGNFVDDVKLPGTTYASFVRSPYAHARIRSIDSSAARKLPGVLAVYTGKDLVAGGVKPIPVGWLLPGIKIPPRLPLAVDRARHMGEAVAVVVAESPYLARDAAELVEVDYEPLPAVADAV
jgi:carbon-monoxide dehydrogenase large subunit